MMPLSVPASCGGSAGRLLCALCRAWFCCESASEYATFEEATCRAQVRLSETHV